MSGPDARPPVLLFLHVPKASGTTLSSIIQRQYPPGTVYRTRVERSDDTAPRAIAAALERDHDPERVRCVMGHMRFGLHRYLARPAVYITMLRHPVRRILSHYEYVRRTREHYLHRTVVDGRLGLDEYVTGKLSPELNDGQVRMLCGVEEAPAAPWGQVPAEWLEAARRNLRDAMVAVGVTERFDESVLLFQKALGWGAVHYETENVSTARRPHPVSERTAALILRHNELDARLYQEARERLAGALASHGIGAAAVAVFRALNLGYRTLRMTGRVVGAGGRRR